MATDVIDRPAETLHGEEVEVLGERSSLAYEAKRLPELAQVASDAQSLAEAVAAENQQSLYETDGREIHPNDVIGYQRRYLELQSRKESGEDIDDELLEQAYQASRYNIKIGFGESIFKLDADFPGARSYDIDPGSGRIHDSGYLIDEMYLRALSAANGDVELARRIVEFSNLMTIQSLAGLETINLGEEQVPITDIAVIEVSMRNDAEDAGNSYVAEIDKLQLRYSYFEDTAEGRKLVLKPAFINGLGMGDTFMTEVLGELGVEDEVIDRTDTLSRIMIVKRSQIGDEVELVSLLDLAASLKTGIRHFLGEEIGHFDEVDYAAVPRLMAHKYSLIEEATDRIHARALELAAKNVSRLKAEKELLKFQKRVALELCRKDPQLAKVTFDERTYNDMLEVRWLEENIGVDEANEAFELALDNAQELKGCPGACGVREANQAEYALAAKADFKVGKDAKLWHYSGARCPRCGAKGILVTDEGNILCVRACAKREDGEVVELKTKKDASDETDEDDDVEEEAATNVASESLEVKRPKLETIGSK